MSNDNGMAHGQPKRRIRTMMLGQKLALANALMEQKGNIESGVYSRKQLAELMQTVVGFEVHETTIGTYLQTMGVKLVRKGKTGGNVQGPMIAEIVYAIIEIYTDLGKPAPEALKQYLARRKAKQESDA